MTGLTAMQLDAVACNLRLALTTGDAARISTASNRAKAVRLRAEGLTLRKIGEAMGISPVQVSRYLRAPQ